jgi:hypothetical protein
MKPVQLFLRCYAEQLQDGQWQAFCLDLTLASQGDSFKEAQNKLNDMIKEYVFDALAGVDKEFSFELLRRRAPLKYWARFYQLVLLHKVGVMKNGVARLFCPPLPLEPAQYNA